MADFQDCNEARGFKLFGTTISLQNHKHKTKTKADQDSSKEALSCIKVIGKRSKMTSDHKPTHSLSDSKALEKQPKTTTDQDSTKSLSDSKTLGKRPMANTDQDSTKSVSDSKILEKRPKTKPGQESTKSLSDRDALENRPDKIVPCPRCKSMDTKFCYFNNYNLNQPRHFCRGCHRYWTAGGGLRDVPIGAGRRKNKPPCLSSGGFPESCFIEASSDGQRFHFDAMVEKLLRWP